MFVIKTNRETGEIVTSKTVLPLATPMQRVLRNKRQQLQQQHYHEGMTYAYPYSSTFTKENGTMSMSTSEGGGYGVGVGVDTTIPTNGMPSSGLTINVENDNTTALSWTTTTALGPRARVASPCPTMAFVYDLERQEEDCPFQLIDLQARQAKRARLQALVEREADSVLGRPNLSQWLDRLHSALCAHDAATPRVISQVPSAWGQGLGPTPIPSTLHSLTLLAGGGGGDEDGLVSMMGGDDEVCDEERMVVSTATEDEDDDDDDENVVDMEEEEGLGQGLGLGLNASGEEEDLSVVAVAEAMYKLANGNTSTSSSSSCLMSMDQNDDDEEEGGDDEEEGECELDLQASEEEDEEVFSTLHILSTQASNTTTTTTAPRHIRPPSVATYPHHHLQDTSHTSHTTTMSRNSSDSDLSDCLGARTEGGKKSKNTTKQPTIPTTTTRGALLTLTSLAECAERAARAIQPMGEYHYVPCQALRPRSDSMAETDVEEFSPELSGLVAGVHASPPPMMLPPPAAAVQLQGIHKNQGQGVGQDDSPVYSINTTYHNNTTTTCHNAKRGFHWTLLAAAQATISPRTQALMQMHTGEGEGSSFPQESYLDDEAV